MGATAEADAAADAPQDPLVAAIAKQEELLRSMQHAHGEFHLSVSDDLAQLATLYNMRGDHERALTLLHKRLVIHEKHGPPERIGETLHELGTTYRLQGVPEMALQHLERALATRTSSHGDKNAKVAETLNSLALLHQADNDAAEAVQLQSLQVLLESDEPVDLESEDVPWEVYKRLKQQRGPSTAANSLTLLKGTLRKCVTDALAGTDDPGRTQEKSVAFFGAVDARGTLSPKRPPSPPHALGVVGRSARSKSDSAMLKLRVERDAMDDLESRLSMAPPYEESEDESELHRVEAAAPHDVPSSPSPASSPWLSPRGGAVPSLRRVPPPLLSPQFSSGMMLSPRTHEPIHDTAGLLARVESVKRRLVAGVPDMDMEIARLAGDVDRLPLAANELRVLGETMVGLVREMHRLRARADGDSDAKQMPVLEGHLEKKSASIFRGFEKRFFKVDAKTFILSYHFSRDDYTRGFAPRGGFPIARISKITVHRQPTRSSSGAPSALQSAGWFSFDVVVDLRTRHNPHATRTYELRADSADARRYWVETLQFYKAAAQATAATSPSGRPSTS